MQWYLHTVSLISLYIEGLQSFRSAPLKLFLPLHEIYHVWTDNLDEEALQNIWGQELIISFIWNNFGCCFRGRWYHYIRNITPRDADILKGYTQYNLFCPVLVVFILTCTIILVLSFLQASGIDAHDSCFCNRWLYWIFIIPLW